MFLIFLKFILFMFYNMVLLFRLLLLSKIKCPKDHNHMDQDHQSRTRIAFVDGNGLVVYAKNFAGLFSPPVQRKNDVQ